MEMLLCLGELVGGRSNASIYYVNENLPNWFGQENASQSEVTVPYVLTSTPITTSGVTDTTPEVADTAIQQNATLMVFDLLKMYIVPAICVFGMLGNVLSLVILSRKRLKLSVDGTERTVHIGLTALAVSDLLFCICLLPHGLLKRDVFSYSQRSFQLFYVTYSGAFINTFILTSTWLTVTMATSRYLAICHPFKARHLIGITGTKMSVLCVFITCLLFNIPRFFEARIGMTTCNDGSERYFMEPSHLARGNAAHSVYIWLYFTFGILLPLALLAFCNIRLVKALHKSSQIRKRYRVPAAHVDANHRITAILVTIVVMYILLVSPSEILLFVNDRIQVRNWTRSAFYNFALALEVTNLLQTLNFSCNFVLYFLLNVHFRNHFRHLMCALLQHCGRARNAHSAHALEGPPRRVDLISLRTTHSNVTM